MKGIGELATATVPDGTVPPPVPGFVVSSFSPLAAAAAERCLIARHGKPPAPDDIGERTAVVVVSGSGDTRMAEHVAHMVDDGARIGPLLFFQAVPNSVAGHVAARWGLRGPVVCLCPTGDPKADGLAQARLLIDDGDADEVLVVLVEQAGAGDSAHALLVATTVFAPQATPETVFAPQGTPETVFAPQGTPETMFAPQATPETMFAPQATLRGDSR